MTKIEKLKKMFGLQDQLNINTCGEKWKEFICEKTGKPISWEIDIIDECAELIRSLDLFHWKQGKEDKENAILEVVDLYHFVISAGMADFGIDYSIARCEDILADQQLLSNLKDVRMADLISVIPHYSVGKEFHKIFLSLEAITAKLGYTFDDVYRIYLTKNTLNKFRVDHGYKDGTYKKIWNDGKEDNYWAMMLGERLFSKLGEDNLDKFQEFLYEDLEEFYKQNELNKGI